MKKVKLFCFPYAGGTAAVYNKWKSNLSQSIDLRPVEMPGRGRRFSEPLITCMDDIINNLYNIIRPELDASEYMLYGHSMGTVVIYEIMKKIRQNGHKMPLHIFVSGRFPPHIPGKHRICDLPDSEFIEEITKMGGTPKELFENKELLDIFVPILRADYKAIETYNFAKADFMWDMDISVLSGLYDTDVSVEDVRTWVDYTSGKCDVYLFEGGHFFINDKYPEVTDIINKAVKED